MWTLQPPAVLLFSSISVRKQRSKQQTKKSSKSSPEVDLVEVNPHDLEGPLDLFSLNVHSDTSVA